MKKCFKCGEIKELSKFYKHPEMADGHVNKCKECNKKDVKNNLLKNFKKYQKYEKDRYQKNGARYKSNKYQKKWRENNPNKEKAKNCISNNIRDKKIFKPNICTLCGVEDNHLNGHHWSYLKYHWLDVIWC